MSKKELPIGVSDFKKIITENLYYVDKSLFIKDVVSSGTMVLLYPRPRRFGKTLNLSMLKYFYDFSEDNSNLFKDLAISNEENIMKKQGKHPVIFITLKDIKAETAEICFQKIYKEIGKLYNVHKNILYEGSMSEWDKDYFIKVLTGIGNRTDYEMSLKNLSQFLFEHYKINPIILIDEYDTPIHDGYYNNYYREVISFMQGFLGGALKDNIYLEKGVLTGILRVARESIFSELNNIRVLTILDEESANRFGFTDEEVKIMLTDLDSSLSFEEVKNNYDGYNFGGFDIYNPWSILNSLQAQKIGHYWANTSSNKLIKTMCQEADEEIKNEVMMITEGTKLKKRISDNINFAELKNNEKALWSFFVMCGYLRYDIVPTDISEGKYITVDLSIPNKEIKGIFIDDIQENWFVSPEKTDELINIANCLIDGDIEKFKQEFIEYCQESFSYYDVSNDNPEKFYHAFVLGMITCLRDKYIIKSNRESGYGRSDLLLIPIVPSTGIIFEFKKLNEARGETFEKAFSNGKRQLLEKRYDLEMKSYGIDDIVYILAIFKGKEVVLESFP